MSGHAFRLVAVAAVATVAGLVAGLGVGLGGGPLVAASATPADSSPPSVDNPLAERPWATYQGRTDPVWIAWQRSHGRTQRLLGKIALAPRTRWYGDWVPTGRIEGLVRNQIAVATASDPDTLVPLADFKLKPWEGEACRRLPTSRERRDYKTWTRNFAAGIGDVHASVVLQPDGPFALCAPHRSRVFSHLLAYAVRTLSALPHTSVYIDAGASDWLRDDPAKALRILLPAGVARARGFALNSTHYASTEDEVRFGAAVVRALARHGIPGKHFVVNTAANGRPFDGFRYRGPDFDNAETCHTKQQRHCVTLGIPPTADVANARWRLPRHVAALATSYCDGYQWVGRPWLFEQAAPFVKARALDVARTTPYKPLPPFSWPLPTVTGVSPSSGPAAGGTVVTVTGTGFAGASDVGISGSFGATPVTSYTVVSPTEIRAVMPPYFDWMRDLTVDLNVVGPHGDMQFSASVPLDRFTYVKPPRPAVTSVSPSSGTTSGGTVVTVTGSGFTGTDFVSFGGVSGSDLVVVSDTELRVTTPTHSEPGEVPVFVSRFPQFSEPTAASVFTYTAP